MIRPGQINRANARAFTQGIPIVVMRKLQGDSYRFERTDRLNDVKAKENLAAFTFDRAGVGIMYWDGPELLSPREANLIDWWFKKARQVAGVHDPHAEMVTLVTEIKA